MVGIDGRAKRPPLRDDDERPTARAVLAPKPATADGQSRRVPPTATASTVRPLTFADLLAMQYRGDGTMALMNGRRTRVLVTVFTSVRQAAVRVVVADAETQAIRARRLFSSLGEAVAFTNEALLG